MGKFLGKTVNAIARQFGVAPVTVSAWAAKNGAPYIGSKAGDVQQYIFDEETEQRFLERPRRKKGGRGKLLISGWLTVTEMAEKYKVSRAAIHQWAKNHNVERSGKNYVFDEEAEARYRDRQRDRLAPESTKTRGKIGRPRKNPDEKVRYIPSGKPRGRPRKNPQSAPKNTPDQ